ncbi:MAG: NFACT family protein [Candidatus ainarchaeum sp.]|nr:NFACT family protein [Candidatus ainarchaeum sp.]
MHEMSALEYSFITAELAPKIVGKHFGRIRKLGENAYRMKIGTCEILCELGVRIHETRYITEAEGDKFTEKAAKELDNARLLSLEQVNNDRIVSFTFDKGALVFEMFGKGNAILVRNGITLCAVKYEKWAGREIAAGKPYSPPAAPPPALETSDRYIIVSLMKLPFGKEYAAEALARAGIDEKTPGNKLGSGELLRLEQELENLRSSAKPVIFYENGKPVDFALARLSRHKGSEARACASLSEAADEYYANVELPNPEAEKLVRRLEKQKERLQELMEEEKLDKQKGDFIYAHYAEIERLLALAKEGKFEELEKLGAKIDKKGKSLEIELQ